jgi:hypothetical protein
MGKQTNAQVLRFCKNNDWLSKYYCSFFNYSNFIVQDSLIRDYILNFMSIFNTKIAQIYIYREQSRVIIRIFSYNDSFTNWKSFIFKQRKKVRYRNRLVQRLSKNHRNILGFKDAKFYDWFKYNSKLTQEIVFFKNKKELDYILLSKSDYFIGYSGKRLLSLNLSYLLKTNVIIKNTNIISRHQRVLLLKMFSLIGTRLRSPLSKYLRIKFICLFYYSLLYKSSLLLCRYLSFIIPRFCKKKRQNRKINPFLKSLKSVVRLMFGSSFRSQLSIKGIKILIKGRINGSRRKRSYLITKGRTSTQSFSNEISYHKEHCLTIFGVLGIKVWIIY